MGIMYDSKTALKDIYDYIEKHKERYSFKRDGIHFSIKCDIILRVVDVIIHGHDLEIVVDDGIGFYTEIFNDTEFTEKFLKLIHQELDHSDGRKKKLSKNDRRHFYNVVKKLNKS